MGPQLTFAVSPFAWGSVRWFTLAWIVETVLAYLLLASQVRRGGADEEDASDLAVHLWIGMIVGARLGEGLFYSLDRVVEDPAWLARVYTGGLSGHGGVLGALLAAWLYAKRRALPLLDVTDRITLSAALIAIVHRLGTLLNSDLVGKPTGGSWGVRFPLFDGLEEAPLRHPSAVYEVALGALLLGVLWLADSYWDQEERPRGALTGLALVGYFGGRFWLDFLREPLGQPDSLLDTGQWLSLPFVLWGAILLRRSLRRREPAGFRMLEEAHEGASLDDDAPSSAT